MATATAPTASGGTRATSAACLRRRTRSSAPDDYKRAEELYQGVSPWGKAILNMARVRLSLESVNFRLHEIDTQQQQPQQLPQQPH